MRLENTVKYHSPKSQAFTDSSKATGTETLTGSDVMAALGMAQHASPLGFSAFSGKMELSQRDKEKAIQLLTQYGMKHSVKVAALRKLEPKVRFKVVRTLAIFAFQDYCRSAASVVTCRRCKGKGLIKNSKTVIKHPGCGSTPAKTREQIVEEICSRCSGFGVVSTACAKCRGRGLALNRKESEYRGIPVKSLCSQCSGRGYERLPSINAWRAIHSYAPTISSTIWDKRLKTFYESLINEIQASESLAGYILSKVTR